MNHDLFFFAQANVLIKYLCHKYYFLGNVSDIALSWQFVSRHGFHLRSSCWKRCYKISSCYLVCNCFFTVIYSHCLTVSNLQTLEHPSPLFLFPSSHCSDHSLILFQQIGVVVAVPVTVKLILEILDPLCKSTIAVAYVASAKSEGKMTLIWVPSLETEFGLTSCEKEPFLKLIIV